VGRHHGGIERQETAEAQAERLLRKELDRAGLTTARLEASPKNSPKKVKIALILRRDTTMTWDWIAQRLTLGSAGYAAQCVREYAKMRDWPLYPLYLYDPFMAADLERHWPPAGPAGKNDGAVRCGWVRLGADYLG